MPSTYLASARRAPDSTCWLGKGKGDYSPVEVPWKALQQTARALPPPHPAVSWVPPRSRRLCRMELQGDILQNPLRPHH